MIPLGNNRNLIGLILQTKLWPEKSGWQFYRLRSNRAASSPEFESKLRDLQYVSFIVGSISSSIYFFKYSALWGSFGQSVLVSWHTDT